MMHDAVRVDREASAEAYRAAHTDWSAHVADEAAFLKSLAPDVVLANVSCLPLAGARAAGIPAVAMCSLNWADQFSFLFSGEPWAAKIHAELHAAYAGADVFLRCLPAMPMRDLPNTRDIPPLARLGQSRRAALEAALGGCNERLVMVVMGGIGFELPVAGWPQVPGVHWLVRDALDEGRADVTAYPGLGFHFSDLLASVDAVITKPGYGMFVEAAAAGSPLLYLRREDWPEQEVLIEWLERTAVCAEVSAADFAAGNLQQSLDVLWENPRRPVSADGATVAAATIEALLKSGKRSA
jgi:hypothetical protein